MSGQAGASKQCEWFYIHVIEQKRRAIATVVMPDGTVRGPAEYFRKKERKYLEEISRLEPRINKILSNSARALGVTLLPYDSAAITVHDINKPPRNGPYNYAFAFAPMKTEIDMTLEVTFATAIDIAAYGKLLRIFKGEVVFDR